ncbi:MAG: hypothetical protein KDA60_14055 [Planctomycetales bacterium]|nr:hypothetical protein [Planctomycetales bacterium]
MKRRLYQRPPTMPKPTSLPRGPKWSQKIRKDGKMFSGPGNAPLAFKGGGTSSLEWIVYWTLYKIFMPSGDPRKPPYDGIIGVFAYQKSIDLGHFAGGSVIDFVVELGPRMKSRVAIRVNGSRYHEQASARQIMMDRLQKQRLSSTMTVIDLWDYELLESDGSAGTGEKAVIAVKRALGMIEGPSRLALARSRDVRYQGS